MACHRTRRPDRPHHRSPRRRWRSALAGLLAAATALAVGELVAGLVLEAHVAGDLGRQPGGGRRPRQVKDFAIETFGTNDKKALLIGIYSFAAIFGLGPRRRGQPPVRRRRRRHRGCSAPSACGPPARRSALRGGPGCPASSAPSSASPSSAVVLATVDRRRPPDARRTAVASGRGPTATAPLAPALGSCPPAFLKVGRRRGRRRRRRQRRPVAPGPLQRRRLPRWPSCCPKPKKAAAPRRRGGVDLDVDGISPFITPNKRLLPDRHQPHGAPDRRRGLDAEDQGHGRRGARPSPTTTSSPCPWSRSASP